MDIRNPFSTTPGSPPPALVGRDGEASAARYTVDLTASGSSAQPIIFTGLRGMGKTALLRQCVSFAWSKGAVVISGEAAPDEPIAKTLRSGIRRALLDNAKLPQKIKTGLSKFMDALPKASYELPNDLGAVSLGGGKEADEPAFVDALEDLNELVRQNGKFIVFAIDEIQEAPVSGLRDLVRFVHATAGTDRPVCFFGAGLPTSKDHLHKVRTYTERWRYFRLGLLDVDQTKAAIEIPVSALHVSIAPKALDELAMESGGYPFFIQEYGSAAWLTHRGAKITEADVASVVPGVRRILEDDFYDARFALLTPRECQYVLAMADLGPGQHTSLEIAEQFGTASSALSSIRNQLIKKDVIYSPTNGMSEFRIPLTERYVRTHRADLERRARGSNVLRLTE